MILIIRIAGDVDISDEVREALFRLKIRRKYSAVLVKHSDQMMKLLQKLRSHVAYGDVDTETLTLLVEKRGQLIDKKKKVKTEEVISQLDKKDLSDMGLKPFFRLHPPRGGIESKKHFGVGKGVLGDNKKAINSLARRML